MADRRLQVFHTVARMLSFTKAAEVLQMTQPAITFQVRQLEEQYNVRLFDRSHNKINLTQAGLKAFKYAEEIFDLYRDMDNAICAASNSICGPLRIGASSFAAQYVLPTILTDFQEKYKDIKVQLKVGSSHNVCALIENSIVDVALLEELDNLKKMNVKPFCEQELVLVVPPRHEFANTQSADIKSMSNLQWIMREEESYTRKLVDEHLHEQGISVTKKSIVMETSCTESIKYSIAAGRGVSILPIRSVQADVDAGLLAVIPLEPKLSRRVTFIYKEQKFPLRIVDEFISFAATKQANKEQSRIADAYSTL